MKITEPKGSFNNKIANMSVICMALVVSIHLAWSNEDSGVVWFVRQLTESGISRAAVPFFFIVSGYFLSAHFGEQGWWYREIKKRWRTLVVPFCFWICVSFVVILPLSVVADIIAQRPFGTNICISDGRWVKAFGLNLLSPPGCNGALWFIRNLFFLVLTSGLIKFFLDRYCWLWIGGLYVAWVTYLSLFGEGSSGIGFFYYGYSISGLLFFSVGMHIRRYGFRMLSFSRSAALLIFVFIAIIGKAYLVRRHALLASVLVAMCVPVLLYSAYSIVSCRRWPAFLTTSTFPVFLMHIVFLKYSDVCLKWAHFELPCRLAVSMIVGLGGPVLVAWIMRRSWPRLSCVAFGGR